VIKQLLTDSIEDVATDLGTTIPAEAYDGDRFSDVEIDALIDAIEDLSTDPADLVDELVDIDTVTVGQVEQLQGTDSYVIKQLVSDTIIDVLATAGVAVPNDALILDLSRLTDTEFDAILAALGGLAEPTELVSDIDFENTTVGQINSLKGTASLIIKQLISDRVVDILGDDRAPEGIFEPDGLGGVTTLIKGSEIDAMIDAVNILASYDPLLPADPITNNPDTLLENLDDAVTVGQTSALIAIDALIVDQLISNSIVDAIGVANVPADAYEEITTYLLTRAELIAMEEVLLVLSDGDTDMLLDDIDTDVTIQQLDDIGNNATALASATIKQLISDAVILAVDPLDEGKVPAAALTVDESRLTDTEIVEIIDAVQNFGAPTDLVKDIDFDALTVGQVTGLSGNRSEIVIQFFSDAIADSIDPLDAGDKIPASAYVLGTTRLKDTEFDKMIDAVDILAAGNNALLVSNLDTNVTIGQLKGLNLLGSDVMDKLITDAIIDAVGGANVPVDAYVDSVEQDFLTTAEVTAMIDVIEVLAEPAPGQVVDDVLVEDVSTVVDNGELQALKTSTSVIFKQLLTNEIETAITNIPIEAYDAVHTDRLSDLEISEMIEAIDILAVDDNTLVQNIDTDVTVDQAELLAVLDSYIIKQLISDEIILFVDPLDEGDKVPAAAYEDVVAQRLTDTEITHMVAALDVLANGVGTTLVRNLSTDITIGQMKDLEANASLIIQKLISDTVVDELTAARIPESAHIGGNTANNLRADEITAIIEVLELLADPAPGQAVDDVLISDIDSSRIRIL